MSPTLSLGAEIGLAGRLRSAAGRQGQFWRERSGMLRAGEKGAEQPRFTDNHIVSYLRTHTAPGLPAILDLDMEVPAQYYFDRYGFAPDLFASSAHRRTGTRALLLMIGRPSREDMLASLHRENIAAGAHTQFSLVQRLPYITAYTVRLSRY